MKRFGLPSLIYLLTYAGVLLLWPVLLRLRHNDAAVRPLITAVVLSGIAPLALAFGLTKLSAVFARSPLPFLLVPFALQLIIGITEKSLSPPWQDELLSMLLAGLVQGFLGTLGWLIGRRVGSYVPDGGVHI